MEYNHVFSNVINDASNRLMVRYLNAQAKASNSRWRFRVIYRKPSITLGATQGDFASYKYRGNCRKAVATVFSVYMVPAKRFNPFSR